MCTWLMSSSWEGAAGLGFLLRPSSSGLGNIVLILRIAVLIAKPYHMEQAEPLTRELGLPLVPRMTQRPLLVFWIPPPKTHSPHLCSGIHEEVKKKLLCNTKPNISQKVISFERMSLLTQGSEH